MTNATAERTGTAIITGWTRDGSEVELATIKNTTYRMAIRHATSFINDAASRDSDIVDADIDFVPFPPRLP